MNIRVRLWVAFAALLTVAAAHAQNPAGGNLRAGAAKLDITPQESNLRNPTDVIRDHLFARAIVVDDGKTCAVLVGFDLSKGDDQAVVNGISRAAASTGCPAENFIVSATHTHSSSTLGLEMGPPFPKQQEDTIVAVANGGGIGYIPSDNAYSHQTSRGAGSRIKPGCAEGKIISKAVELIHRSGQ
jgi:neutral ceramidase